MQGWNLWQFGCLFAPFNVIFDTDIQLILLVHISVSCTDQFVLQGCGKNQWMIWSRTKCYSVRTRKENETWCHAIAMNIASIIWRILSNAPSQLQYVYFLISWVYMWDQRTKPQIACMGINAMWTLITEASSILWLLWITEFICKLQPTFTSVAHLLD